MDSLIGRTRAAHGHGVARNLDTFRDPGRNMTQVGEGLEDRVVRRDAADFEQELFGPRLDEGHDLGRDLADLVVLLWVRNRLMQWSKRGRRKNIPIGGSSG